MKKILSFIIFTFGLNFVSAECGMSGMQFFPEKKDISLNPMFIIQGYSFSQKTVESFKERNVFLESENGELILLNLQEVLQGQMNLNQAIFKPVKPLQSNTKYFLQYSNQTQGEISEMFRWNPITRISEKVYWQTSDIQAIELLNPTLKINYKKTAVTHFGCGPSSHAVFEVLNKNNIEIWYKTEVIELSTNTKTIFYITEWQNRINVGHDMCSGAFRFKNKGQYKVSFTPMNIDGASMNTTDWQIFNSPFEKDQTFTK